MTTPPYLSPGDKIALVATGKKVTPEVVEAAENTIRRYGYVPVTGVSTRLSHHQFAGTDNQRALDLQTALDSPDIRAILLVRGGYGLSRIIDKLRPEGFLKHPKWLAGFSDITLLHAWASHQNITSLHCAMPINFGAAGATESVERLFAFMAGRVNEYTLPTHPMSVAGACTGRLAGGNLSMLQAMSGAPFDYDYTDTILFIEDTDEYLYHIDRMMQWLRLRGTLGKIKGLIVGHFDHTKDNPEPFGQSVEEIITDACRKYGIPIAFGFPAGHVMPNMPLRIGCLTTLEITEAQQTIKLASA